MILWENLKITFIALGIALVPLIQVMVFAEGIMANSETLIYSCIVAAIIMMSFMMITVAIPARKAAKVQPVEALSEE